MDHSIALRPMRQGDRGFLYEVYASTREEELAPLDWDDAAKDAFLRMQFETQDAYYCEHFGRAAFQIVLLGEEPIGRLYVDRRKDEIRIIDIALLAAHRNQGIGTALLAEILAEGAELGLPVRIHVEQFNPALRFYERLGFYRIGETGVYYLMEWSPPVGEWPATGEV